MSVRGCAGPRIPDAQACGDAAVVERFIHTACFLFMSVAACALAVRATACGPDAGGYPLARGGVTHPTPHADDYYSAFGVHTNSGPSSAHVPTNAATDDEAAATLHANALAAISRSLPCGPWKGLHMLLVGQDGLPAVIQATAITLGWGVQLTSMKHGGGSNWWSIALGFSFHVLCLAELVLWRCVSAAMLLLILSHGCFLVAAGSADPEEGHQRWRVYALDTLAVAQTCMFPASGLMEWVTVLRLQTWPEMAIAGSLLAASCVGVVMLAWYAIRYDARYSPAFIALGFFLWGGVQFRSTNYLSWFFGALAAAVIVMLASHLISKRRQQA